MERLLILGVPILKHIMVLHCQTYCICKNIAFFSQNNVNTFCRAKEPHIFYYIFKHTTLPFFCQNNVNSFAVQKHLAFSYYIFKHTVCKNIAIFFFQNNVSSLCSAKAPHIFLWHKKKAHLTFWVPYYFGYKIKSFFLPKQSKKI